MAEIGDALLRGLGAILSFFYGVIPSYGLAIILLTVLVRLVMFPLTYRQTRSLQAMQRLQPKIKELQRKHKGNRQKLNEEMMKLYKEHQVNPLGGCLPLLLQFPVFIALYAVLRGTIIHAAIPTQPVNAEALQSQEADCRPASEPAPDGVVSNQIVCTKADESRETFTVEDWKTKDLSAPVARPGAYMSHCAPQQGEGSQPGYFLCSSTLGISHLPAESELRAQIIEGNTPFLGMQLACSPSQAASENGIRQCAPPGTEAGGFPLVGYFGLVALMVLTTWYQQRQMQRASAGPQAQQARLMGRIMPIFLGYISINIPTGVLVYWVTSNAWQIGQQTLILRSREQEGGPAGDGKPVPKAKPSTPPPSSKSAKAGQKGNRGSAGTGKKSGSRNARGRKKRSKR
jgi:YidC/Oxa1 family membrane protein insertase